MSDFGCCLADEEYGLKIPFATGDTCKGGNPALMAPEVKYNQAFICSNESIFLKWELDRTTTFKNDPLKEKVVHL